MIRDACPSEEQLAAFVANACSAQETIYVHEHARHCPQCARWLHDAARNDEILLQVVKVLRKESSSAPHLVAAPPQPPLAPAPRLLGNRTVDGYTLLREVGHGGQGVVYEALEQATRRTVAVKVLRPGTHAAPSARRRFEREIELAASLRHPNIVTLLHSGKTPDGHPFCVMDFVHGQPLDVFVRAQALTLEQALELFATICGAVAHAHRKGVIHRDLKPSNVIVDLEGNPRILDFGLAKLTDETSATLISLPGQVFGTLPYASPEHVRGSESMDTRSDVYALGVVLYRLLTGDFPYPVVGTIAEVAHHILETAPTPPSHCWRRDAGIAGNHARRPRNGSCPIDGEVETILLKALAKEPQRRYQSADELAGDIRHYLRGEPIAAKRDSGLYVLRKSLRRHRGLALGVFAAVVALVVTGGYALYTHAQAAEARDSEITRLANAMTPKVESPLIRNLRILHDARSLLADQAGARGRSRLLDVRQYAESELLRDIEVAMSTNDYATVADALLEAPASLETLRLLNNHSETHDLLDSLCTGLERWIRVPPPAGRTLEMQRCSDALVMLKPHSARARDKQQGLDQLARALTVIDPLGFAGIDEHRVDASGHTYLGSDSQAAPWSRSLQLEGTCKSTAVWTYTLATPITGDTVSWTLNLAGPWSLDGKRSASMSAYFLGADDRAENGAFYGITRDDRAILLIAPGLAEPVKRPLPPSDTLELALRYHSDRATCDVLLDGELVIEEAPGKPLGPITAIRLHAEFACRVVIRDFRLAVTDAPLSTPLGDAVPILLVDQIGLEARTFLPIQSAPVVFDFDHDGIPEIFSANLASKKLAVHRFDANWIPANLTLTAPVESATPPLPAGVFGPYLVLCNQRTGDGLSTPVRDGCAFVKVLPDLTLEHGWTYDYPPQYYAAPSRTTVAELLRHDGHRGLAVGLSYEERRIDFVGMDDDGGVPSRAVQPFQPLDIAKEPHDIESILPWDCDGDGEDDLLIGWGAPDALGMYLVHMHNGQPDAMPPTRLSKRLGITRLAATPFDQPGAFVAAAASPTSRCNADQQIGVWAWRAEDLHVTGEPRHFFHDPGDARAVAVGRICGREVIAALVMKYPDHTFNCSHHLRLYEPDLDRTRAELIWEAMISTGAVGDRVQLQIVDLNNDAQQELVAWLPGHGIYVFAANGSPVAGEP